VTATSPILHILAGPNGAGKTTLYEVRVRRLAKAPFVNADRLSFEALGRYAQTRKEAELGQSLANARRDALMAAGESLVTESTFSHPSKLELVRRAKALGYRVFVYHVNVDSDDDAVARVAAREARGGHPVPEANIRGRYERNQPLIREAARMADWAFVFDNSDFGKPPRRLITFVNGQATDVAPDLPAWAKALYAEDLR
jgi:predicted ABC-type ATPase